MELSTVHHSHWEKGDESKEVLRRGQTDTFKFAIKSLRNLTHVTLGHDGRDLLSRVLGKRLVDSYM